MMTAMTKRQLKAAITAAREGKGRGRYPAQVKAAIIEHCRDEHARGIPWTRVAGELGLNTSQLYQWNKGGRGGPRGRLRRVVVVAPPDELAPVAAVLRIELPGGGAVTGLSVHDVAQLLKELQ